MRYPYMWTLEWGQSTPVDQLKSFSLKLPEGYPDRQASEEILKARQPKCCNNKIEDGIFELNNVHKLLLFFSITQVIIT